MQADPHRDEESVGTPEESSEESSACDEALLSDREQRQRAGAAAAYAAAAHKAPARPGEPEPEPQAADPEQQVEQDLDEIAARAEKADEYLLLAQRTQADFENYRKRAAREAALAQERGIAKLAKELLPAVDNLARAIDAAELEQSQLLDGLRLVHAELLGALARVGIEPFSPEGEQFDPQHHEAVAQQPIEGAESGTVAEVFQQGFRFGESVLRPARVLVAA